MSTKPWDDPAIIQDGDLLYRYVTANAFAVFEPDPTIDAPPGYDEVNILSGEQFQAFLVATIVVGGFLVHWSTEGGNMLRMKSETVARLHFPNLGDYRFIGESK